MNAVRFSPQRSARDWSGVHRLGAVAAVAWLVYSIATIMIVVAFGGVPETALDAYKALARDLLRLARQPTQPI
jgi:hypothetical protein